jgi:putative sugar O-methyltransferase
MLQQIKAFVMRLIDFLWRKRDIFLSKFERRNVSTADISDSQKTYYEKAVNKILKSKFRLKRFRRIYDYRKIVETVTFEQGEEYLKRIEYLGLPLTSDFSKFFMNDIFGKPTRYRYPIIGKVSPTTLRYISIAMELKKLFGDGLKGKFVEIGVGYGGQVSILKDFFKISEYGIYDLEDVQELTARYLTRIGKVDDIKMCSLVDNSIVRWDLVISNYAFSELPSDLQKIYVEKVLSKSDRGYLVMNSGMTNYSGRSGGKLTLEELRILLPEFQVFKEIPNTGPDNYVIVWGHSRVVG